jgi:dephospho-CoA kinase
VTKKTVIGVTGMPGAGKDVVREVFRELGFPIVTMGDEVRAEAERKGLPPTPENLGKTMLKLRAEEGQGVLAKRCLPKIEALNSKIVVVDGIRSLDEVAEYKKEHPDLKIIAVHASPETRFERLVRRNRSDDPEDWKVFNERDQRELSVGLGNVIAAADIIVVNEGKKEAFKQKLRKILNKEFRV